MIKQNDILQLNVPLAKYTSWRVGGSANKFAIPNNIKDLQNIIDENQADEIYMLGLGSNVLVRDGGIDGIVVNTTVGLNKLVIEDDLYVYAEAGVPCAKLARFCARSNLHGAEFFAGIPGTVGGALRMNAGCFGSETWEWVECVDVISKDGNLRKRFPNEYIINYRSVQANRQEWFVGALFKLKLGKKSDSLQQIKQYLEKRAKTQPTGEYSCGSVFRNPPQDYAGRLIEESSLKGVRLGGAIVSSKHANFIVNNQQATAKDIEDLILLVQQTVKEKFGILLQREVHIIGKHHYER